ncbi:MAG: hypothetical protein ACLU4N_12295 [Butyricimonas faecihominis]
MRVHQAKEVAYDVSLSTVCRSVYLLPDPILHGKRQLPETGPVTNQLHLCRLFQHRIPTDSRTHCGNNLLLGALDRDAGTGKQTPESLRRGNRLSRPVPRGIQVPQFHRENIAVLLGWFGVDWKEPSLCFLPLGISFYTFQALGYLIDVYWEEEGPNAHYRTSCSICYFHEIPFGRIERALICSTQLKIEKRFDYDTVTYGLKLMLIGLMKKS